MCAAIEAAAEAVVVYGEQFGPRVVSPPHTIRLMILAGVQQQMYTCCSDSPAYMTLIQTYPHVHRPHELLRLTRRIIFIKSGWLSEYK